MPTNQRVKKLSSKGNGNADEEEQFDIDKLAEESELAEEYDIDGLVERYVEEVEIRETSDYVKNLFASCISSIISTGACHPFDVLRKQIQAERMPLQTVLHKWRVHFAERGPKGFYKRHQIAQVRSLSMTIALFGTYEPLRNSLDLLPLSRYQYLCDYVAGFISGTMLVLVLHPLDKYRLYLHRKTHLMHLQAPVKTSVRSLFLSGALQNPYGGAVPRLAYFSQMYGCNFMFYDWFTEKIVRSDFAERYDMMISIPFLAGAISGMLSCLLNFPLETLDQQLEWNPLYRQRYKFDDTCRHFWQCAAVLLRREGLLGFYKGVWPAILRSTIFTSLQFSIFDHFRQLAEENM